MRDIWGAGGEESVAFIDLSKNEIQAKIVYYGPGRCGKTTNLLYVHQSMSKHVCGKMVTIDTKGDIPYSSISCP